MDILIRALVIFALLWLMVRLGGKREVAQMNAFDMILLITVGDLVSQAVLQEDYSLTAAVIAVATFMLAGYLLTHLGFRFPFFRTWLAGEPRVVVRNGEAQLAVLSAERMSLSDLHEACREQGIRRLSDIELAVLETDGSFSFFTHGGGEDGAREDHEIV